jgi:hypothetical protein
VVYEPHGTGSPRRYDGYPLELRCLYTVLPIAEGNGQGYAASSKVQARLPRSSSDLQRATGTRSECGGPRPCRWPAGGSDRLER